MIGQRTSQGAPVGATHPRSLLALLTGYELLRRRSDARNIERLRAEIGCSPEDAGRLYAIARQHGYGAAYETVFGAPPRHSRRRPIAAPRTKGGPSLGGLTPRQGHPAQQP